jgi:hypothetical protein
VRMIKQSRGPLSRLWGWVKYHIAGDVPEDIELCAMDCDKDQCTTSEWEVCERRLQKAAGELMPAQDQTTPEEDTDKEASKSG